MRDKPPKPSPRSARGAGKVKKPRPPSPPSTKKNKQVTAAPASQPAPTEPQAAASASPPPKDDPRWRDGDAFPIVGIGASAGGLEALEKFFAQIPERSGVAFVVIQHLDPTHEGMLVELLQRGARIEVLQARDRLKVERDHVYVIPPNKDLSILHGTLHLLPQSSPRGLNLPIDFFFRSLAEDQQDRGIGVILSGMGSDGTLGLRAIKEKAGAAFVQAIGSAKFDGMPRSAIEAGLADVVVPVEQLPEKILTYCQRSRTLERVDPTIQDKVQTALEKVFVILRTHTGNDFSLYKKSTIYRRIERRMGLHQIDNLAHYVRFLRENPREVDLLFKELLIGVTSFFREPATWDVLRSDVIPALISRRTSGGMLRAWVPGCSTGEEAYSLAMAFKEAMEPFLMVKGIGLQIFATDLDREAIEKARIGLYPTNIAADVSPERLKRFFVQEERGFRVGKEIREMVVFAPQNITKDPPFTKLDILSCRNLLIYLSADLQKKLIPIFHYSLTVGGVLFLGSAETIGSFSSLFAPLDTKTRLYRRLDQPAAIAVPFEFPSAQMAKAGHVDSEPEPIAMPTLPPPNLQTLADRLMVQRFSPVGILCNDKGDVLYISGRAGRYLEPAVGKANLNIFAMAREGLRYDLSSAFGQALREDRGVNVRNIRIASDGATESVDLNVQRLGEPKELRGTVLVVISDNAGANPPQTPPKSRRGADNPRLAELEGELQQAREEVQTAREEMQTSQEELKSTNEELQSTNEELQSSNEELTTSKEEMQSLNEELQTVNHELQAKVDELSRSNNDMKNLLNSTDIATLFLDGDLHVRRFTTPTSKIIKLIPADAGRPITDIATNLDYPALADDAREVLRSLVFKEKQVAARDQRWYVVRIMPYRTLDNVIDGVVITFTDMSTARQVEAAVQEQLNQLRRLTESLPNLIFACRANGSCDYLSPRWVAYTGIPEAEHLGYGWIDQAHPDDRERVWEGWRAAVKAGAPFDLEMRIRDAGGAYRWFKSRAVPLRDADGNVQKWSGSHTDIHDVKRAQELRGQGLDRVAVVLDGLGEGFIALNSDLVVTFFNAAAEGLLERDRREVVGSKLFDVFPHARASGLPTKLREAMRSGSTVSFDGPLDGGDASATAPRYRVRLQPLAEPAGVSIFLERITDGVARA